MDSSRLPIPPTCSPPPVTHRAPFPGCGTHPPVASHRAGRTVLFVFHCTPHARAAHRPRDPRGPRRPLDYRVSAPKRQPLWISALVTTARGGSDAASRTRRTRTSARTGSEDGRAGRRRIGRRPVEKVSVCNRRPSPTGQRLSSRISVEQIGPCLNHSSAPSGRTVQKQVYRPIPDGTLEEKRRESDGFLTFSTPEPRSGSQPGEGPDRLFPPGRRHRARFHRDPGIGGGPRTTPYRPRWRGSGNVR